MESMLTNNMKSKKGKIETSNRDNFAWSHIEEVKFGAKSRPVLEKLMS